MPRIVFREDGCQIVDDLDRVLFVGGYAECEHYLDAHEALQVTARSRRAARIAARTRRRWDPAHVFFSALRFLFRRVPG